MTSHFTFTHEFTSDYSTPGISISHKTGAESADELVSDFYHFLLGCGFQHSSIVKALRETAADIGEES